ncbi:hypothetical protein [Bacillus sp. FJAT-28004]|uniref:hypothetical protein n=1 Tax=Bacillus sp. FJAT-28004 TaxID=1679165 RepID=UPI0006B60C9E|nr:hypothetical protein [Bacillus sp. FJAT-28004]
MISEEQLDKYRVSGETIRVVRDAIETNDVKGIVVAWDESSVVIRRPNRRVVKLSREYSYTPASEDRLNPFPDEDLQLHE